MANEKKEPKISILGINIVSFIVLIIGICGIVVSISLNNELVLIFSAVNIGVSLIPLSTWIPLIIKNRKELGVKEFLQNKFTVKEIFAQLSIFQIILAIVTLILIISALIL